MIEKLFYLISWYFKTRFLGKKTPLQTVLFISDQCNLKCRHCHAYNDKTPMMKKIGQVKEELLYAYRLGSRFVDFEGGEPIIWRDGDKNINDLIALARQIGFYSTTVTTNAQLPFVHCKADALWVSMDGVGAVHDAIRGQGTFAKLEENIASSTHLDISVNMVINAWNYTRVKESAQYAKEHPAIKMISFNFHTPYPGTEDLFLPWDKRKEVIREIIEMKREGFPIMNSYSGLKLMENNSFKKRCWISNFITANGSRLPECPGRIYDICSRCGLCMAGEMHSLFSFKPDTILAGLKLRVG